MAMTDKRLDEIRTRYEHRKQEGSGMMLLPFETIIMFQYVEQLEAEREEIMALVGKLPHEDEVTTCGLTITRTCKPRCQRCQFDALLSRIPGAPAPTGTVTGHSLGCGIIATGKCTCWPAAAKPGAYIKTLLSTCPHNIYQHDGWKNCECRCHDSVAPAAAKEPKP